MKVTAPLTCFVSQNRPKSSRTPKGSLEGELLPVRPVVAVPAREVAPLGKVPLKGKDVCAHVGPSVVRRESAFPHNPCGRTNNKTLRDGPVYGIIDRANGKAPQGRYGSGLNPLFHHLENKEVFLCGCRKADFPGERHSPDEHVLVPRLRLPRSLPAAFK